MTKLHQNSLRGLAVSASVLALVSAAPAWAQAADEIECPVGQEEVRGECVIQSDSPDGVSNTNPTAQDVVDVTDTGALGGQTPGAIVVTGSRIKRDTYSSISPLQVLTSDTENEAGLFDPSQILQRSESASGQQIDATFQGFVLDNGPGSQTLNLRGLGADRTLLLVNGRRLAPAGVEGAPTNPSINLLPGSLIDRYDLLLDGASSVYGSDAVAGVGNIILRKDFDGLELFASGNINPEGGGDDYTVSGAYGLNLDRGFVGIGAEYSYRDTIRLNDRGFFSGCDTDYEVTQDGEIRTVGIAAKAIVEARTPGVTVREQPCKITSQVGRAILPYQRYGSVFYTPGQGNTGIPNFDVATVNGRDIDADGDGFRDVDYALIDRNGSNLDQVFLSEQKLYNVMAYGEYTLPGEMNITPFFEANYSRAEIFADNTGAAQLFPYVPAFNQFNPCFRPQDGGSGVDCPAAEAALFGNPGVNRGLSLPTRTVVSVRGDRNNTDVVQEQYRGVFGLKGDLPFIAPSWSFEVTGVYSRSEGSSVRRGIREDKLAFALGIDPTADFDGDGIADNNGNGIADDYIDAPYGGVLGGPTLAACNAAGLRNPGLAMPDLLQGCVPVNLFSPTLLGTPIGDFATQAERDYLFGVRSFDTTYEQIVASAFVTGDLFELPAGPVGAVFGVEYRKDKIDSQPDVVASDGLFFGFFADQGAQGSKDIKEAFAEFDIPLEANKPWVRELNLNLSGRVTDEEFYGTNFTYSVKGGWRPIDPLLIKMSYGTSFRAPNLRENFLAGQSGFLTLTDPCAVPVDAYVNGAYNPTLDNRDQSILANCQREGRDPTRVGIDSQIQNVIRTASTEITSGGSLDIDPETSRSITAGFAFEETFGDGYDVSLGLNYFDIKLKGSIVEPSAQFILNDCFTRADASRSPFCDRISYDTDPSTRLLVSDVNSGFINLNQESVRGIDLNANFGKEVSLFGKFVDFGLNIRANHLIERSNLFIDDTGNPTFDEDAGEFGLPKWNGRATFTADVDKFRLTYQLNYTGAVEQDPDDIDEFSDAFGNGPDGLPTGFVSDTCLGGGSANGRIPGDGVFCRDVGFAKEQFLHTASIRYREDRYSILLGVSNIFDTAPPLVDSNEVLAIANTAIGLGYDYDGREFFASVEFEF